MCLKLFLVVSLLCCISAYEEDDIHFPFVPDLDGRIVGGIETDIRDYPYQLSLEVFGQHSCGAALIAPKWVITAAHCTDGISTYFMRIRAGSTTSNSGGKLFAVRRKYIHSQYNNRKIDYDISLLKLSEPITENYAQPVELPEEGTVIPTGQIATVTGWGTKSEKGEVAQILNMVQVPILDHDVCEKAYGPSKITSRMLCAGYTTGGRDACQGDSGGPLVLNNILVGVVSWGYGCARPEYPGVYTNVASVRSFIKNITGI